MTEPDTTPRTATSSLPTTLAETVQPMVMSGLPADVPLLELRFYIEESDGGQTKMAPSAVPGLDIDIREKGGTFRARWCLRAEVLRIAIGPKTDLPTLGWGKTYVFGVGGKEGEITVPELANGRVQKLDVVFRKFPVATPPTAKPESIEGTIVGLPKIAAGNVPWRVVYDWGKEPGHLNRNQRDIEVSADGVFSLKGVPLGGELVVVRGDGVCFAYMREVTQGKIVIPGNATFVGPSDKTAFHTLKFARKRLPEGTVALMVFMDNRANMPLAAVRLPSQADEIVLQLPSGTYEARALIESHNPATQPTTRSGVQQELERTTQVLRPKLEIGVTADSVWITEGQ